MKSYSKPKFYLFDTFEGLLQQLSRRKSKSIGVRPRKRFKEKYDSDIEVVRDRFGKVSDNFQLVPGTIPESITESVLDDIDKNEPISFLHIDMNNSVPEVEALLAFYSRIAKGGVILFDDYAYNGYEYQKNAIDEAWKLETLSICLPTGQGLILKNSN